MAVRAYGDSITVGVGASPSTNSFIKLLEADVGAIDNRAVSSSQAGNQAALAYTAPAPVGGDIFHVMLGSNDFRKYKSDATKRGYFEKALLALTAWLSTPLKKRVGSGLTLTGTWTSNAAGWNRSTVAGAKATATVNGSTVYVGYHIQDVAGTLTSLAKVRVDGVEVAQYSSNGVGCATFLGADYYPNCIRITGLDPAITHTVEVEQCSNGQYVYVDWIAGNSQAERPTIYLSNLPKMADTQYTADGTSDALLQSYNSYIAGLVSALVCDGTNAVLVDSYTALDPVTGLADGVHPNNTGHLQLKNARTASITPPAPPPPTGIPTDGCVSVPLKNGGSITMTLVAGKITCFSLSQ